jgi:hypothetical protein
LWANAELEPRVFGYQIQRGTRWNPGLRREEIDAYESALGVIFPAGFRRMLTLMNGTDLPTINLYGSSGIAPAEWVGVYAYPRDLELVRTLMALVAADRAEVTDVLASQGFTLHPDAGLVPVYEHRFLVCDRDLPSGPVLSIHGTDAIVYGSDLLTYLRAEFLDEHLNHWAERG